VSHFLLAMCNVIEISGVGMLYQFKHLFIRHISRNKLQ
jgi:hypothetical protein